ncbi:polyprotein [Elysia marginata]|uniref:Polyprotein n=1 Tax=Elysia marginata TaxID=1093978 RepID=A0AAV4HYT1_9GAST|nr:polyprotein [Elysia marginata]
MKRNIARVTPDNTDFKQQRPFLTIFIGSNALHDETRYSDLHCETPALPPAMAELFQQPKSGTLAVSREDLEAHLKKTYSDTNRELPLEETAGLLWPAAPGIKLNNKPPNLQEVVAVVKKARAKSAPGPNEVPYLLYKRCPNVLKWLHKILQNAWNNINFSEEWMAAE